MKIIRTYHFLLFIFFALLLGCKEETVEKQNIKITGEILNYEEDKFEFSYFIYSPLERTIKNEIEIDDNGNFLIELDVERPIKGTLHFGRHFVEGRGIFKDMGVYAEPGDSIHISVDVDLEKDLELISKTLTYSGSGIANNEFLKAEDGRFNSYPQRVQNNHDFIANKNPDDYKKTVDSIRDLRLKFLEEFSSNNELSEDLKKFYKAEVENLAVIRKFNYPTSNKYFNEDIEPTLPPDYYEFVDKVELPSDLENRGLPYLRYLHFFLQNKYDHLSKSGYEDSYIGFLEKELEERPRYIYMAYSLGGNFDPDIYAHFGPDSPHPDIAKKVKEKYGHLERMLPGNPAPQVEFISLSNDTISSSDYFKDKFVYIDFWATWCKPCIREIPDLVKLEKEYHGQNIIFASISFDEKPETWKKFVEKEGLTGVQLWMNKENKEIYDHGFNITMIPRFVLLDDQGRIVNANAPRPSSGAEIRELLDRALQKEEIL